MLLTSTLLCVLTTLTLPTPGPAIAIAGGTLNQAGEQAARLELQQGDRICLIGGALAERMQHHGWLEARMQQRLPSLGLSFRNMGFSADELTVRQRTAGFMSQDEYLAHCRANVVFAFFGYNESFGGSGDAAQFKAHLEAFISHTREQSYDGQSRARLVLFSSIPFEDLGDSHLPDGKEHNERISQFNAVLAEVAAAQGVPYVDLYTPMIVRYQSTKATRRGNHAGTGPLTINGIHLSERGNAVLSELIVSKLVPRKYRGRDASLLLERLRSATIEKNLYWFNRYRATDGFNVYGGRSTLSYTDGQSNFTVLQRELVVLDAMCENGDRRIQAIARGEQPGAIASAVPQQIPVITNRPGPLPRGEYPFLTGEEAIAKMTPAAGMRINLFADEDMFPELASPVQMSWDTRGRLWVAVWPTYPHWQPGKPMNDKLLILEDVDGDGRADTCKTFAGDLHNPTGFEFWNGGVLVANAPDLLFLKDTDGDDHADSRERVLHGLSSGDTHHSANSFVLGPDGGLYFQEGTFHMSQVESIHGPIRNRNGCVWRFVPRTWRVERYVPYNFANPHGHVFNEWGQDFVTDGTGNVNYFALGFNGHVPEPDKHRGYFSFFRQSSRPAGGTEFLSSAHFPDANQGNYLIANCIGFQGIFQYEVSDDGSGYKAKAVTPIVHSKDPNFRPVDLEMGPDGALYFLDWQNPIIGHMQHHLRDPSRDAQHGRVYRVTWEGRPLLEPAPVYGQTLGDLFNLLKSHEDRLRYRVRIELTRRSEEAVVSAARSWVSSLDPTDARYEHNLLEALWAQMQHDVLDRDLLLKLLQAERFEARAAATRALRNMRHQAPDAVRLLRERIVDEHPRVRLEALVALSFFPTEGAADAALLVMNHGMDRFLTYALDETMRALGPQWHSALAAGHDFAAGNAKGLSYVIKQLTTEELTGAGASEAAELELLRRHGVGLDTYEQAARGLAARRGTTAALQLLGAIERADSGKEPHHGGDRHVDHLLSDLFKTAALLDKAQRATLAAPFAALASAGERPSTRRLATAARIRAEGSIATAWSEATRSIDALIDFLEAAPLLNDERLAAELFPHVLGLLEALPGDLEAQAGDGKGTNGRYVRVELKGDRRTLSLAEVEVLSLGSNVAAKGQATQSTVAHGGSADRAIDGNKAGEFDKGGQTHTITNQKDPWWELDLGREYPIDAISIYNRTEFGGSLASRLDGYILSVLDGARHTVFSVSAAKAPAHYSQIELTSPALRVRRAAVRCLTALGQREGEALEALVARFGDAHLRSAIVEALHTIPFERWPADARAQLAQQLLARFAEERAEHFLTDAGRGLLALADEVLAHLDDALALQLYRSRRDRGPQVIMLRPVQDALIYDRKEFTVVAGRPVELLFANGDIMPHNLVITAVGALAKVGMAGEAMSADVDAWARAYVPDLPEVLVATGLVQPGESEMLSFDAPEEPGDYPYVCTFPGHWIRMNGVMHVVAALADVDAIPVAGAAESGVDAGPGRTFVRNWTLADLAEELGGLDRRNPQQGHKVAETATCLRCHKAGGEGGVTGPPLEEIRARYDSAEELLQHILQPSLQIAEGYQAELFLTADGQVFAGRVTDEDAEAIYVQDDPYRQDALMLRKAEIDQRSPAKLSTMPEALLSTFSKNEILDLLAYLMSLEPVKAASDSVVKPKPDKRYDLSSVDLSEFGTAGTFDKAEGTTDEEWSALTKLAATMIDPLAGAAGNRAIRSLKESPRKSFPALLSEMLKLDFQTERGYRDGDLIQKVLMEICKGRNFGWRYSTEARDALFNKKIARAWAKQWEKCVADPEYWSELTKRLKANRSPRD